LKKPLFWPINSIVGLAQLIHLHHMSLRFNKTSFLSILTLTFLLVLNSSAQKTIFLEANDSFDGERLKVEWRVESQKTGRSYVIKDEDGRQYVDINKEDEVQMKAILDFYYIQDRLIKEEDLIDGEEFKFPMDKRPSASLRLLAQGIESKRNEPAAFELFFEGRMIGRGNTTRNSINYDLILNQAGTYEIVTKAVGFAENRQKIEIQIGNPTVTTEKIVLLEKPAKEIAIRFKDEQTGEPINSNVSISETSSGKVLFHGTAANGVVLFTFKNGINYKINATSANYRDYEKSIDGDLIARLRPYTYVIFKITDSRTAKEIPTTIGLTSPKGVLENFAYSIGDKIRPNERGDYKIEIKSDGYISSTGTLTINSLQSGEMVQTFSLVEADKQFYINVIDHFSKRPIARVDFRVFGPGGQRLPGLNQNDKGEWYFITDPEKSYFIEASANGYQDFTKSISEDNKRFTIELYWTEDATHSFKMVEMLTHRPITNGHLKLLNAAGEELYVHNTGIDGVFLTHMYKKESLNYAVSAVGYKPEFTIKPLTNNSQELELSANSSDVYVLNTFDFLTLEPLQPSLKYYFNKNPIDVNVDANTKKPSLYFGTNGEYSLEAKLPNYKPFVGQIKQNMVKEKVIDLPLKKEAYSVQFRIENLESARELSALQFRVLTDNRVRVPELFSASSKLYQADLDGEIRYTIEVVKDGYETYNEYFFVKDLVQTNFIRSFKLTKKVIEEPKEVAKGIISIPEPEKTEAVKPKPVAVVLEKKEMAAPIIPKSTTAMAQEFSKQSSKGKRYLLDEVYFDQGSSSIRNAEVEQLNELAKTIKENSRLVIEIVGYTDNVGDPRLNLGLSQFRAKAVSNYLFNKGADPDRIMSNGFGQEKAVASNDSEEDRVKNRRVEMVLIEN
jgi:outer membrane protein OmpA-like peptidoglycan-associated protein